MRDFARHKLLLGLASSIVKQSSRDGVALPHKKEEALVHPYFSELNIYDPSIPVTSYLKDTLGECLDLIGEDDYLVLKAHVHSIQHDSVDMLTADNIVFSGGGGKGIGYSGLMKYLSSEKIYAFSGTEVINFINEKFPDHSIPRDSKFYFSNKLPPEDFINELRAAIHDPTHASHALYLLAHEGLIKETTALESVQSVSGTSAGAITALPVALGMNYEQYSKLMVHSQFNHFFLSSSDISSRVARIKNPDLYRNKYVKRFSELYREEITKRLEEIMPSELSITEPDEKKVLMSSLLRDATPYGIDYLYHRTKSAGVLDQVKQSVEDKINQEIGSNKPDLVSKFFRDRAKRLTNSLEHARDDFDKNGGFKSKESTYGYSSPADEAFYISLYQQSESDNISMFFGKLISNRLKNISVDKLKKAAPGKYEDAFFMNPKNASSIIRNAIDHLSSNQEEISDEAIFKTCHSMCTLRKKDLFKSGMMAHLCVENTLAGLDMPVQKVTSGERQVVDNALSIIESLYLDKRRSTPLSEYASGESRSKDIADMPSVQRACSRSFYNDLGSLTFKELRSLKNHVPDEGFKDLYIAATGSRFAKSLKFPETLYFSGDENSNMPIQDAIRASMSLPVLFKTTKFGQFNLSDGGIFENTPITPFQNDRSTIVAMAENDKFFKNSPTFIKAWKKGIMGKFMYHSNEYRKKFSLSESMRGVFSSSHHYATTNFSFTRTDLDDISGANKGIFEEDKGFTKDAMYYFLKHKDLSNKRSLKSPLHHDDHLEEGLHEGVFSKSKKQGKDMYGKTMLRLSKEHEESYSIYDL